MAKVKIIKRHSLKKFKRKKSRLNKKPVFKNEVLVGIISKRKKKVYPSHKNKLVYTYVLKDIKKNIYKIGKTADPHARFKSLCKKGRVMPIALVNKDIEGVLHKEYADNRIFNEEYKMNGATEWFKPGGKFDKFIETVDKGKFLPYITLHSMTKDLIEDNVIRINDSTVEWELSQSTFGYYLIGLELLVMLGYIKKAGKVVIAGDRDNILLIGRRISVSDHIYNEIKSKYFVYLAHKVTKSIISENKVKTSRLRKVVIEDTDFDSELFLLLNSVL